MIGFLWACIVVAIFWMLLEEIRFSVEMDHLAMRVREMRDISELFR